MANVTNEYMQRGKNYWAVQAAEQQDRTIDTMSHNVYFAT
jgi:hypothetical protein